MEDSEFWEKHKEYCQSRLYRNSMPGVSIADVIPIVLVIIFAAVSYGFAAMDMIGKSRFNVLPILLITVIFLVLTVLLIKRMRKTLMAKKKPWAQIFQRLPLRYYLEGDEELKKAKKEYKYFFFLENFLYYSVTKKAIPYAYLNKIELKADRTNVRVNGAKVKVNSGYNLYIYTTFGYGLFASYFGSFDKQYPEFVAKLNERKNDQLKRLNGIMK